MKPEAHGAYRAQGQFWWQFGGSFQKSWVHGSPARSRFIQEFRASPLQSSTGIASHARGHRFESCSAHHTQVLAKKSLSRIATNESSGQTSAGRVEAIPQVGGPHHRYERRAA